MKILVLTLATSNITNYSKYTHAINRQYCKKHSYDFISYDRHLDPSRHPAWSKIKAIHNHIDDYDWIMWIDADAIFLNHNKRIEPLLDDGYNIIISKTFDLINSGVFLIKGNNEWSKSFLDDVYDQTQFLDSTNNRWEENAIEHLYLTNIKVKNKFKIINNNELTSFNYNFYDCKPEMFRDRQFNDKDLVLHLSFVESRLREKCFKVYFHKLVRRLL